MRCRRRIIFKLLVFLLAGAMINVAVAWGCVLNPLRFKQDSQPLDLAAEFNWWRNLAPEGMSAPDSATRRSIPGVYQDLIGGEWRSATNIPANESIYEEAIRVKAGLPVKSLVGTLFNHVTPADNRKCQTFHWIMRPPPLFVSERIAYQRPLLPLLPLWPGFAINTVFYAAILWMMFALPFAIRRRRRITRGLCARCGYPVGNSGVCSECGSPVQANVALAAGMSGSNLEYNQAMGHDLHDRFSLEVARRIARELPERPDWIELARANLARWRMLNADAPGLLRCYAEWEQLLQLPVQSLCEIMTAETEESTRLRHNSPFAGALPVQEIRAIKNRLRDESIAA